MRRRGTVALLVLPVLLVLSAACGGNDAKLAPLQDLPEDVAALVDETWGDFAHVFSGRIDCIPPVSLVLVDEVPDGDAVYRRDLARIEIEIPTSPARFPESLVHELAHHVEATCPAHAELRIPFLAAQGLLDATGWFDGEEWAEVPSEHFAEAVVGVVNGERLLHEDLIVLTPEAIEIVSHWARGDA